MKKKFSIFCLFRNSSCLEKVRFVYQDIGSLEPLPKGKVSFMSQPPKKTSAQENGNRLIEGKIGNLTRQNLPAIPPNQHEKNKPFEQVAVATNALRFMADIFPKFRGTLQRFAALNINRQMPLIRDILKATRLVLVVIRACELKYKIFLDKNQMADFRKIHSKLRTRGLTFPTYEEIVNRIHQLNEHNKLADAYHKGYSIFAVGSGVVPPVKKPETAVTAAVEPKKQESLEKYPEKIFFDGKVLEKEGHKTIALTFDDGPDFKYTPQILKILAGEKVKATFYLQGMFIRRHPEVVKQIATDGHEIALHSYDHINLKRIPDPKKAYKDQAAQTNRELERLGLPPSRIYRPAEGSITDSQVKEFARQGLVVTNWSIDTFDWQKPSSSKIRQRVMDKARPGAIVLMHSAGGDRSKTVAALPGMIADLRKKGFVFLTTSEILGLQDESEKDRSDQKILAQGK